VRHWTIVTAVLLVVAGGMLLPGRNAALADTESLSTVAGEVVYLPLLAKSGPTDEEIAVAVVAMDPAVRFEDDRYILDETFDPEKAGVDHAAYTVLRAQLEKTNAALASDKALQKIHRQANTSATLAGPCNKSGTEFTWYGYKVYLDSEEADQTAIEFGYISAGTGGVTLADTIWFRYLPRPVQIIVGTVSFATGAIGTLISQANKGCGIVTYHTDMNVHPFWIRSQQDET